MKSILYTILFVLPLLGSAQVNQQDSIALRTVWEALNGPNWSVQWTGEARSWTGTIWNEEGRLTSIRLTSLRNIEGSIDPAIGSLTELTRLELGRIDLEGSLPQTMSNLVNLEILVFLTRFVTAGELRPLADLGTLTKLKVLNLFGIPSKQDTWPTWLRGMTQLENLGLRGMEVDEPIPDWFNELINLDHLFIDDSKSTGIIPDLSQLNLKSLTFAGQNMDPQPFPEWVTTMDSLERLGLYECNLIGTVPPLISNLEFLVNLRLNQNNLEGDIGEWADDLTDSLAFFFISGNNFTGALRESYFNPEAIGSIDINDNQIDYTDPFTWFEGTYMRLGLNRIPTQYLEPIYKVHNRVINTLILDNQSYLLEDTVRLVEGSQYIMESGCSGQHDNYIWYKDGDVIEDAIDAYYTIESFSPSDAGVYWCEIKNDSLGDAFRTTDITVLPEIITVIDPEYHVRTSAKLYPNPSRDITNIESDQQINKIRFLTARGDMIYEKTFHSALKRFKLNTSHFQPGLIYVQIFTPHDVHTLRLIKS